MSASGTRSESQASFRDRLFHVLLAVPTTLSSHLPEHLRFSPGFHLLLKLGLSFLSPSYPHLLTLSLSHTDNYTDSLTHSLPLSLSLPLTVSFFLFSLCLSLYLSPCLCQALFPSASIINFTSCTRLYPFSRQSLISSGLAVVRPDTLLGVHIRRTLASILA